GRPTASHCRVRELFRTYALQTTWAWTTIVAAPPTRPRTMPPIVHVAVALGYDSYTATGRVNVGPLTVTVPPPPSRNPLGQVAVAVSCVPGDGFSPVWTAVPGTMTLPGKPPPGPGGPVGPVGPVVPAPVGPRAPVGPVAPVGPLTPVGPAGPVGPVGPRVPVAPFAPVGPV